VNAILITHEHSDHVCALPALAKALDVPVYVSRLTAPLLSWNEYQPKIEIFQAGSSFRIGDIEVDTFTIPHDAIDPVGFCFRAEGCKIGLVTDLGYIPDSVRYHLRGSDVLILESNHDVEMLKVGPYPWSVKQRVMSRKGHLSNDLVGEFIVDDLDARTSTLMLGHLSEHTNYPDLVRLIALQALGRRSLDTNLVVLEPRKPSEVVRVGDYDRKIYAAADGPHLG
jgi:phosphoribosyl 1,2-cyclic phosphodiesterase